MTTVDAVLERSDTVALLGQQSQILEQIATGAPLSEVLTGIARTLEMLVPECRCSVLLLDREAGLLRHGAAPSLPVEYSAQIDGMTIGADAGSCGTAAWSGSAVVATDIRSDARWERFRSLAGRFGLRACWSTPIRGRGGVSGTFAVYHDRPHHPAPREEHLVQRLTHLASIAIDHDGLLGALADSEERFRRAFEDNAVGMALTNLDGNVTRVNRAMQELLLRVEGDLVGVGLDSMFTDRRGSRDTYEATTRTADGRMLDVAVTVSSIRDAAGTAQALSVSVLDITGRRAAERERRRRVAAELARAAAEAADQAKSDFVSALGHELRTPLQAITGFTELLGTLDLDEERRAEALGHIAGATEHILTIVDDVLDVTRTGARALRVELRDVAVAPVVDDVLAMLTPLAAAERVTLRLDSSLPVHVRADEGRLRQVLLNLVNNAIRYNRASGDVHVGWSAHDGAVCITVGDTGRGISAEHLARVFVPFDRLGCADNAGIGLGLPLARGLTEAMGGSLEVRSAVDLGTTVSMCLAATQARG